MRFSSPLALAAFAGVALSQDFEPADFNITEALFDQGVNVSALPELADLSQRSSTAGCAIACDSLKLIFGSSKVIRQGAPGYDTFTNSYWSVLQEEPNPYCIFKPSTGAEVSVAVLVSRLTSCPFAAKSGGHAAFAGASSIEGGITISFETMQAVKLSSDHKIAAVEPGNRWGKVYRDLDSTDVTVIGGRVANIGTGGLTTGGGISFFSSQVGWACDNVASYDVVTASGIIVRASPTQYPDLYWALRGGGNNFGLVINFNLNTVKFPGQTMWGGTRVYLENNFPAVTKAYTNIVANSPQDPAAGLWVAWLSNNGTKLAATELWSVTLNGAGGKSPIFKDFNAIPSISDTTMPRTIADYAAFNQASNPNGLREVYYGLTLKLSQTMADQAKDIFYEEAAKIADVAGSNPVMIYQGITTGILENMEKNGGNPLGLSASDGPFFLIHVACWWNNAADDKRVYAMISKALTRISAKATSLGKMNDYIYMNYASQYEDVIKSYGASNKAKLKSIATKYDPTGVFQELQPGYFKLDGAPTPNSGYYSGI